MKFLIFSILLFFGISEVCAQEKSGRHYVKQDESVDKLISSFRQHNRNRGMQGFRVQVYTASGNRSKLLTDRVKAEFDAKHPGVRSYITYDEPYYKLRVGDFRSRLEAQQFLRRISSDYIYAIVVVDRINLPRLRIDDEQTTGESAPSAE
ncbi:MAG: SPOR domain-containing protein [Bacteroidetes bacterium]|nr:MAG: SPOR domain-containing protein [Bacteroidota bacterium]